MNADDASWPLRLNRLTDWASTITASSGLAERENGAYHGIRL